MNISELLGRKCLNGNLFGVEIEAEFEREPAWDGKLPTCFRVERDGSLRGIAYEYIFRDPLSFENTLKNVKDFYENIPNFKYSFRAGTHVHVNFSDKSVTSLLKFVHLMYLCERVFVRFLGEDRVGNYYCLTSSFSEIQRFNYLRAIQLSALDKTNYRHRGEALFNLCREGIYKYSAVNFSRLVDLGTVELRFFPTDKDVEKFNKIMKIINFFLKICVDEGEDFYDFVNRVSNKKYLQNCLTPLLESMIEEEFKGAEQDIEESLVLRALVNGTKLKKRK